MQRAAKSLQSPCWSVLQVFLSQRTPSAFGVTQSVVAAETPPFWPRMSVPLPARLAQPPRSARITAANNNALRIVLLLMKFFVRVGTRRERVCSAEIKTLSIVFAPAHRRCRERRYDTPGRTQRKRKTTGITGAAQRPVLDYGSTLTTAGCSSQRSEERRVG